MNAESFVRNDSVHQMIYRLQWCQVMMCDWWTGDDEPRCNDHCIGPRPAMDRAVLENVLIILS